MVELRVHLGRRNINWGCKTCTDCAENVEEVVQQARGTFKGMTRTPYDTLKEECAKFGYITSYKILENGKLGGKVARRRAIMQGLSREMKEYWDTKVEGYDTRLHKKLVTSGIKPYA